MASVRIPSVPLVVRVKRSAEEEPLDVIRLCPPRSKVARGEKGAFSLQDLEFKHAGTILNGDELPARTAELIDGGRTTSSGPTTPPVAESKTDGSPPLPVAAAGNNADAPGVLRRNQRMYVIAKAFRPVSTTDLDDFLDPWARFYADDRVPNAVIKRKLEEGEGSSVPAPSAGVASQNFVLCDLETYNESSQERQPKKSRRNLPVKCASGIKCNDEEMVAVVQAQPEFVYDIYTFSPPTEQSGTAAAGLYDQVYDSMTDLDYILGTNADNDFFNEIEIDSEGRTAPDTDEDDSNDEDNWRNDYPDEEESEKSDTSGSGKDGSSDEEQLDSYTEGMFGMDHSYASRRAYRTKKTIDSDEESEDGDQDEEREPFPLLNPFSISSPHTLDTLSASSGCPISGLFFFFQLINSNANRVHQLRQLESFTIYDVLSRGSFDIYEKQQAELPDTDIRVLTRSLEFVGPEPNQALAKAGDLDDCIYILQEGRLMVSCAPESVLGIFRLGGSTLRLSSSIIAAESWVIAKFSVSALVEAVSKDSQRLLRVMQLIMMWIYRILFIILFSFLI
ncbi:hypothetical protein BV898_14791 [Hypsibius exemplaris]|uniref:Probable RNA polymerase II nuclear localization protein SLC7A6OS n=1 Tax=Hypsibius exemplaris TaxID=2072580 RepID=A0A9X6RJU4_HYPEX|nr:hypothetical protein BV898_14791 [Hypsibius exemplaris]